MRTASFVVFVIVLQDAAQPGLMEDNDVVQALTPNGADVSRATLLQEDTSARGRSV